jgi:tetratricopeptide (TPR) repeat protein
LNLQTLKTRLSSPWAALLLIAFIVAIFYSNIYPSPFVFDDHGRIVKRGAIRDLANYSTPQQLLSPRSLVDATFALNYKFGKLNVSGYHLVNLLIHIINGFIVYFLALVLFQQILSIKPPGSSNMQALDSSFPLMSLLAALIFVAHPIQTQAVTYTVQRYASMAGMFYMATVLLYLMGRRAQQSTKSSALFILSFLSGLLAFLSKENTASLPGVILLTEYLLFDRTWEGWKKKIPWFALSFSIWIIFLLVVLLLSHGAAQGEALLEDVSGLMKETETVSRWRYLCTQFNVIVIYIKLLFLPVGQNLDHLYTFKKGFFDGYTPFAFLFLVGLVVIGILNVKKRPIIPFTIFWFFLTLSVESSIIPIRDALFEHRLYLPMFGFVLFVVYLIVSLSAYQRILSILLSLFIVLSLGTMTLLRNHVWRDGITLWSDVISKNPLNPRAHHSLGSVLAEQGHLEEAASHFSEALRIMPDYADALNNLGSAQGRMGKPREAVKYFSEALRIDPEYGEAHYNMGIIQERLGNFDLAVTHLLEAVRIRPDYWEAHNSLGSILMKQGKLREAERHTLEALRFNPDYAGAHNNLGSALARQGKRKEAMEHFLKALSLNPEFADAHHNLGVALREEGRLEEAVDQFSEVIRINPDNAKAHLNLALLRVRQGRDEPAIRHFSEALRLEPDSLKAHFNLANLLEQQGNLLEATRHYKEVLRIDPRFSEAHNNLGAVLMREGNLQNAISHFSKAIEIKPEYAEAHNNLGAAMARQGEFQEAVEHFSEALKIKPDYADAKKNLDLARKLLGRSSGSSSPSENP